ncbi:MAG: acetyltransferase [Bacteroidetes bacterium]|nr:MAG: acetyltransferase [Bacteroidota bacterium]
MYFLETERIGLRPLTADDASPEYLSWLNDPEVTRGIETGLFPTTPAALEAYLEAVSKSKSDLMFAIIDKANGKHIGNCKLANINWVNRNSQFGIIIGDKPSWGKGFGKEACSLLVNYAFEKLNLHKVWLIVYANNPAAQAIYEKAGFVREGCQKEQVFSEGTYVDTYLMAIFNPGSGAKTD